MVKYFKIPATLLLLVLVLASCQDSTRKGPEIDTSKLQKTELGIHRYGEALFSIDTTNFTNEVTDIHEEFKLFLGNDISNPSTLLPLYNYVVDTHLISIAVKTMEVYPSLTNLETQLGDAFSRNKYFFPDFQIPEVYSYISNLYYEKPIIINNSIIIIALDVYLGGDYTNYRTLGLPYYIVRRMTPDNIAIDVMKEIYNTEYSVQHRQKTLIDKMIASGKELYYLDAVLPQVPDSLKIGYSAAKMKWIESNAENVWAFLVNNKLFYSADFKIHSNFMKDAPFTTGFSNDSPSRIGQWLGWQIVRKYMSKHPEESLSSLIKENDFQKIFNESGYKP